MAIVLEIKSLLPWLLIGLLISACGNRNYKVGTEYLANGHYASAIEQLTLAERDDPSNWKIKRDLGIAYYKNEQYKQAIAKLSQANSMQPKNGKAFLYLGLSYESNRNFSKATSIFKSYASRDIEPRLRTELHARIRDMSEKRFRMDIRQRLASLERGEPIRTEPNSVAVLYFRNLSRWEELTPILKGIAELITTELGKIQNLKTVDRLKLQILLEELQLTPDDFFDHVQAQKVGKLLGADRLISGGAERITETILQLNAGVIVSQTGKLMGEGVQLEGSISEVVQLTNKLVVELLDDLEVRTTDTEYRQILEPPTNSSLAFIAFSKGLDYEDRDLHAQARYQYNKALKLDPDFKMAEQKLAHLPGERLTIWEMEKLATALNSSINGKTVPVLFSINQF